MERTQKLNKVKTYSLNLTKEELDLLEDVMFEKSSILTRMADYKSDKNDLDQARKLDTKASQVERIAYKASFVLDDLHLGKVESVG